MANAINFMIRSPSLGTCRFKTTRSLPISSLPSAQLKLHGARKDGEKHRIFISGKNTKSRPYHIVASLGAPGDSSSEDANIIKIEGNDEPENRNTVSKTIREFYECVNGKNVKRIAELVSEDCTFDDYSFPQKFEGKKEVCDFFYKLSKSMGETVKFQIEDICEGDRLVACATWHLKWKEEIIPFTRGCSFFRCVNEGDKLVIRDARVVIESPAKPGVVVVGLLELIRSVFDDFPDFTGWFLKSPQVLLQILVNIYNTVAAPFINPLLMFYTQIGMLVFRFLSNMIDLLRRIVKLFK